MILSRSSRIVTFIMLIILVISCSQESRIFIGKWKREDGSDYIEIYKNHKCKASLWIIFSETPSSMVISEPVNIRWEVPNPEEEFKPIVPMDGKRYELDIILKAQFTRPEVRTEKNGEKSYWLIFEGISEFNANWRIKAEKTIEFYVIGKDQKTNSEREFVVLNLTSEERGLRLSQGEIPILIPLFTEGIFLKEPRK